MYIGRDARCLACGGGTMVPYAAASIDEYAGRVPAE
jgi:hypothetical protein